jgi:hypothetical protein
MKKSIGFVSLFVAFLITSALTVYVFNNYMNENAESVLASVSDYKESNSDFLSPEDNLCDPFCIVRSEKQEDKQIFEDMTLKHKNAYAVSVFHDLGLVKGYEDGNFLPDNNLNRVELLSVVLDALDADFSGQILEGCFKDVKDEWFSAYVCYAKNHNIVNGYSDGNFKPANNVNRAEALKITLNAFGFDASEAGSDFELEYSDVSVSDWYAPYLFLAKEAGIVSRNGIFEPNRTITRAEEVQLLYNTMHYRGLIQ